MEVLSLVSLLELHGYMKGLKNQHLETPVHGGTKSWPKKSSDEDENWEMTKKAQSRVDPVPATGDKERQCVDLDESI